MRSKAIVIALALFLVGAVTVVSADEAVLIDFSLLKADILPDAAKSGRHDPRKSHHDGLLGNGRSELHGRSEKGHENLPGISRMERRSRLLQGQSEPDPFDDP